MILLIQLFVILYSIFTVWCLLGTWRFLRNKTKPVNNAYIPLNELSIIIPFRNEALRIQPLLNCIKRNCPVSIELIFVDDHSDDNSNLIISSAITNAKIIKNADFGKKQALYTGIKHTKRDWILTWDADIHFSENYFKHMAQLPQADLLILPVRFEGNFIQKFLQLDTELAQITNYSQAGFGLPILSSGANLLFSKQAYLHKHSLTAHQHISSGDDQFLLQAVKQNGGKIALIDDQQLAVYTPCETRFMNFLFQRLRWIGKTPFIKDSTANTIAIIQFSLHLLWSTLVIISLFQKDFSVVILLYLSKTFLDFLICLRYFINRKEISNLLYLPLFELYFPIYSLILGIGTFFIRPKWKNRTLNS